MMGNIVKRNLVFILLLAISMAGPVKIFATNNDTIWQKSKVLCKKYWFLFPIAAITGIASWWGIKKYLAKKRESNPKNNVVEKIEQDANSRKKIIRQYIVPKQPNIVDCAYRAIYNGECIFYNEFEKLYDTDELKRKETQWKSTILKDREWKRSTIGTRKSERGKRCYTRNVNAKTLFIDEIDFIIEKHVPRLSDNYYEDGMREVHLKDNVSIIQSLSSLEIMLYNNPNFLAGTDRHTKRNIERFQNKKEKQLIIFGTHFEDKYFYKFGMLNEKRYNPKNNNFHWATAVIEYIDKNTIQITFADSFNNKNEHLINQLCNLFTTPLTLRVEDKYANLSRSKNFFSKG
jgi:hypothetical protein